MPLHFHRDPAVAALNAAFRSSRTRFLANSVQALKGGEEDPIFRNSRHEKHHRRAVVGPWLS